MAKPFDELRSRMSPERQQKNKEEAEREGPPWDKDGPRRPEYPAYFVDDGVQRDLFKQLKELMSLPVEGLSEKELTARLGEVEEISKRIKEESPTAAPVHVKKRVQMAPNRKRTKESPELAKLSAEILEKVKKRTNS